MLPPRLSAYLRLLRPSQSYKALIVWLPALFYGGRAEWIHAGVLIRVTASWMLASGIIYILNDLFDKNQDRSRPNRRGRPIASGEIGISQALVSIALLAIPLVGILFLLPAALSLYIALYLGINLAYSLGLKEVTGLRQLCIAVGFWLRLKSGASPIVDIPLTLWASIFTLGLAYHLNCLKGLGGLDDDSGWQRTTQIVAGVLAGSLALVALTTLCLKRGTEGTLLLPELPPLLCLVALHRAFQRALRVVDELEQSHTLFRDPVVLVAIGGFVGLFLAS